MCALAFDLVTPEQQQATVARLVALIEQADVSRGAHHSVALMMLTSKQARGSHTSDYQTVQEEMQVAAAVWTISPSH